MRRVAPESGLVRGRPASSGGGASLPASGGALHASGGASLLASGGALLASGGASSLHASGGASPLSGGNALQLKVGALVKAVRKAIAARPRLHCPLTKEALDQLEAAVGKEFRTKRKSKDFNQDGSVRRIPGQRSKNQHRKGPATKHNICYYRKQVKRKDEKIKDLEAQLSAETTAKGRGGQITAEWLSRCALAAPTVSLRSLVRSFKDIRGQDAAVVSRTTIKAARGALSAFCYGTPFDKPEQLAGGGQLADGGVALAGGGDCKSLLLQSCLIMPYLAEAKRNFKNLKRRCLRLPAAALML